MSFTAIHVHMVWATKKRQSLLKKPQLYGIIKQIRSIAKEKEIHIVEINGHLDHIHTLISLGNKQSMSEVAQYLKGGSSYWANNVDEVLFKSKLKWAKGYYATSVSKSNIQQVVKYIAMQEQHHANKTFKEECDDFFRHYGYEELYE